MVYYHTSSNIKILRNIMLDYAATSEVSPYEYMKTYIEKCPEDIQDAKISWIVESFLEIQKHIRFLKEIASYMSNELSDEDQDYVIIILHAVTFQIGPKCMPHLYKCLFNLSKPLLNGFTKFLGNNEILAFISQIAQSSYDTDYITEKIISPLFEWQPYISEMAHNYAEYVKKVESRRLKPPTVPIQPKVLSRKTKESPSPPLQVSLPVTPPNSVKNKCRRMLTKSAIDLKLKQVHEKNKQRANHLLNDVKNKHYHYAQVKSDKSYKKLSNIKDEIDNDITKPVTRPRHKFIIKGPPPPVKDTATTVKRINKRMQIVEEEEVQWLHSLVKSCNNVVKVEELEEYDRQERERERLYDIERKHLMGQISREEAFISKNKLREDNRKKYEQFLKEKEIWNEEIEKWKKSEIEKNRKYVEKLSMIELNILQAKNGVMEKKKDLAENIKKESEVMLAKAMKIKQEELDRKINMIKEIKILALIAKKAKAPKIIDLTESSGIGLLCEMSITELQERLNIMKMELKEELERKKTLIKEENTAAKQELEAAKSTIKNYMTERAILRKQNKKSNSNVEYKSSKEINDLKKMLEEKRKLRIKMSY
ncbi:uncharacterized protein LOC115455324 [Manduca sexta]|uniref:uncharacterized protein LOC115455324 n=1 Tax=Manduca sexta TaxID=7130 RepID=UPI00188F6CEB|nr:uncharacterized protein LOC115455324 [Manduca sexta]